MSGKDLALRALFVVLLLQATCSMVNSELVLDFQPSSSTIQVGSVGNIKISQVKPQLGTNFCVNFTYGTENEVSNTTDLIKYLPGVCFSPKNSTRTIDVYTLDVGHLVIGVKSDEISIPTSNVFRVDIIHSDILNIAIIIIGWMYFAAWSISFYPQVVLNYRLKDVSGLSFDFIFLNFLGHTCYAVFNITLFWIPDVQTEYFKEHPRGVNPVLLNDVFFSIHAATLTLITIAQCIKYKKSGHGISLITKYLLGSLIGFLLISGIVCFCTGMTVLTYIYFFTYVKLFITICKYIPQAYMNFRRKSTVGWSILNVLLDFTGGALSLLQMFFLAYNYNDWTSIFGSPTKFGLGLLSILFDLIFMFQHYVLYRNSPAQTYTHLA